MDQSGIPELPPARGPQSSGEAAYCHTQKAPLHWVFYPLVLLLAVVGWLCRDHPPVMYTQWGAAGLMLVVAFMFRHLTVRDEGDCLAVRFGPLPAFRRLIRYTDITAVEPGRSAFIDGWGVHWIPGRGTTYNLWGFGCVKLTVQGKTLRVGSDDVDNLTDFLRSRLRET